jgi:hypothetical protein
MDLCDNCSLIDWKAMLAYDGDDPPRHSFTTTSESQCMICRILCSIRSYLQAHSPEYNTISNDDQAQLGPTDLECYDHWLDQLGISYSDSIRSLKLYFQPNAGDDDLEQFFWTFPDMHESPSPQIRKKSDEEKETGRVDYDLVRSWLSICEIEHTNLCRSTPAQLDLFFIDVSTRCIIKAPKGSQYLALSYVCGKTLPNLEGLTPETWRQGLGASHERLPDMVPRAIEDAMHVVRELNHKYLWVDAYCISQYDASQRAYFIRHMDQIYEGAYLTIVALSGDDSDVGLAGVSRPLTYWPQTTVKTTCGTLMVTEVKRIRSVFRKSRWISRGWTLQEGTLSCRCLCFEQDTYFLWCREELFSEVAKVDSGPGRLKWSSSPSIRPYCFGLDFDNGEFTMVEFQNMLQAYTARQFTRSSDALNAITGMLNRISRLGGVKFSYGMPTEPDFVCSLLWTAENKVRLRRRPGFPSWSWLGWEGKITCTSYRVIPPCKADAFRKATQVHLPPGVFWPGTLGIGVAGQYKQDLCAWQAESVARIEDPTTVDDSQELHLTTARAIFPLVMLTHDGDDLPHEREKAVGDFWTMIDNDGESIGKRQNCRNYYQMRCADAFRVEPEISAELIKVSSAAEFLLMHHWIEAHEDGKLKEPHEWAEYGRIGDIVSAILAIRNSDNTARRVALVTMDYKYWIQGNPQPVEIVLV